MLKKVRIDISNNLLTKLFCKEIPDRKKQIGKFLSTLRAKKNFKFCSNGELNNNSNNNLYFLIFTNLQLDWPAGS